MTRASCIPLLATLALCSFSGAGEELKILAANKLDGGVLATPAVVDGNIYVRTDSHLYAFGK